MLATFALLPQYLSNRFTFSCRVGAYDTIANGPVPTIWVVRSFDSPAFLLRIAHATVNGSPMLRRKPGSALESVNRTALGPCAVTLVSVGKRFWA